MTFQKGHQGFRKPAAIEEALPEPAKPVEREYKLKLRRGYWPVPGTPYFLPEEWVDENGVKQTKFTEGVTPQEPRAPDGRSIDEAARKGGKLNPGTVVVLPFSQAKPLLDAGKAELDVSIL